MALIRTERGLDRLVNFSDATVAIAITLLILPLVDLASEFRSGQSVGAFVGDHFGAFVSFFITFFVIGQFWRVHHRVFEWVTDYTQMILRINMIWLVAIVFLPFAANALADIEDVNPSVYAMYIGTMAVASASMLAIEVYLSRHPALLREELGGKVDLSGSASSLVIFVVALVLSLLSPQVGMYWLLLLFLSQPLTALVRRILTPRSRT